jgi:hypothetical protein
VAEFEALWLTLRRWEVAAGDSKAKAIQQLRGGLAMLMRELEALAGDSE